MSVHVALRGRLGNNLFQYALGRLVAERHGLALDCRPVELPADHPAHASPLGGPAALADLREHFPEAPLRLPGREIEQPIEAFEIGTTAGWTGQTVPLSRLLSDERPCQFRFHGYFQRFEYLAAQLDDVRQWFTPEPPPGVVDVGADDVAIHIRRGLDYGLFGWVLPFEYYDDALSTFDRAGQVHICGIGIDDETREHFSRFAPRYHVGTPLEEFQFIQQFNRIVLSNDTTAWWAAFLSDAKAIVAPRAATGTGYAFTGFRDVDLHMREPRYREIDVQVFAGIEWHLTSRMLGADLYTSGAEVLIALSGRPIVRVPAGHFTEPALIALTHQEEIEFGDLARQYPALDVQKLADRLAGSGLVNLRFRHTQPARKL